MTPLEFLKLYESKIEEERLNVPSFQKQEWEQEYDCQFLIEKSDTTKKFDQLRENLLGND